MMGVILGLPPLRGIRGGRFFFYVQVADGGEGGL